MTRHVELNNRFAMAPTTRGFSPGGAPGSSVADYCARRAAGGLGLIITEGTWINHPGASNRECRRRTHATFPIIFRYSQWKQQDYTTRLAADPGDLEQILAPIVDAGVDIIHPSTRRHWDSAFEDNDLSLAGWTRKITSAGVTDRRREWHLARPYTTDHLATLV